MALSALCDGDGETGSAQIASRTPIGGVIVDQKYLAQMVARSPA